MKQMVGRLFPSYNRVFSPMSYTLSGGPLPSDKGKGACFVIRPERFNLCFWEEGHGQ